MAKLETSQAVAEAPIELLTETEAAQILRVKPKTLQAWRFDKEGRGRTGPVYLKIGRLVKYRRSDLYAWLEKQVVDPAPDRD